MAIRKEVKENYTWVMFALTPIGSLIQRSALRKAYVYPYLHWQIQIFEYMGDLLIQTLIFLRPAGFRFDLKRGSLSPTTATAMRTAKKAIALDWQNKNFAHFFAVVGEISIPHKLGFSEISSPQSLLPSNVQISNLMLINLFIIVFILLVIHCVWQNNKIK